MSEWKDRVVEQLRYDIEFFEGQSEDEALFNVERIISILQRSIKEKDIADQIKELESKGFKILKAGPSGWCYYMWVNNEDETRRFSQSVTDMVDANMIKENRLGIPEEIDDLIGYGQYLDAIQWYVDNHGVTHIVDEESGIEFPVLIKDAINTNTKSWSYDPMYKKYLNKMMLK